MNNDTSFTRTPTIEEMRGEDTDTLTHKRTRTSPRLLCLNEVQAIITQRMEEWAKAGAGECLTVEEVRNLLNDIYTDVETLKKGHPQAVNVDGTTSTTSQHNTHYVGKTADGTLTYINRKKDPTTGLVALFGPFHTKGGAKYAAEHGIPDGTLAVPVPS